MENQKVKITIKSGENKDKHEFDTVFMIGLSKVDGNTTKAQVTKVGCFDSEAVLSILSICDNIIDNLAVDEWHAKAIRELKDSTETTAVKLNELSYKKLPSDIDDFLNNLMDILKG